MRRRSQVLIIGFGLLVGVYSFWAVYQSVKTITAGATPTVATVIAIEKTATLIIPTQTTTPLPSVTSITLYDFELGTQEWTTSEGEYKQASLRVTKGVVYKGAQALQLVTELAGNASSMFSAATPELRNVLPVTEAVVYFKGSTPQGFQNPPPYDLVDEAVSCYVYLPETLTNDQDHPPYIRIFVKDTNNRNQYSIPLLIEKSSVEQWKKLSLVIESSAATPEPSGEESFDASQVSALGLRIEVPPGSNLEFNGSLYIDYCTLGE